MFVIVWEYQVKAEHAAQFERVYAGNGSWAKLFQQSRGYLGTELLVDESQMHRYITIDRWTSAQDYE